MEGPDRDPMACRTCNGTGSVELLPSNPKPWDGRDRECPDCFGGRVACDFCGEGPASVRVSHDGWLPASYICAACDEEANNPGDDVLCRDQRG